MDPASELRRADGLHLERQYPEAIEAYRRAVAGDASLHAAWYGLGCACFSKRAYGDAADALRRAVALRPDADGARCNLAEALFQLGEVDAAIGEYRQAAESEMAELRSVALAGIACIAPGAAAESNSTIMAARRRWIDWQARDLNRLRAAMPGAMHGTMQGTTHAPAPVVVPGFTPVRKPAGMPMDMPVMGTPVVGMPVVDAPVMGMPVATPEMMPWTGRKLRIGYLGAFFDARNWMKMYMGVLNAHDRDRFEVHFLADGGAPCADCGYVDHAEDRIWEIGGVANADLAPHIIAAGLDVLVDLNGYSYQRRLPLFLYRPARRQICWNGMYGTTGLRDIDWLVGDAAVIPPEEERFYDEPIARVPGTYLAFWVFYRVPDVAPPPCLQAGYLTFGCFASAYKLTEQTIASYAGILREVPSSRLLLRNRTLEEASNRAALLGRFAQHGVAADRLTLEGGAEHFDFLRGYDRVDVALDTFPYNGGTTTAEALWQGVPVLSAFGDRWAGRTSCSLLMAGGLDEWVAADLPGFHDAAIALTCSADTPARLAALRGGMRERLRASAACDVVRLCRSLEALYLAPGLPA